MPNREELETPKILPYHINDTEVKAFFGLTNSQLFYGFIAANCATSVLSFALGLYSGFNVLLLPIVFGVWLIGVIFLLFLEIGLMNSFRPLFQKALEEKKQRRKEVLAANNIRAFVYCGEFRFTPYFFVWGLSFFFFLTAFLSGVQLNQAEGVKNFKKMIAVDRAS
jgi:hypothetical protein